MKAIRLLFLLDSCRLLTTARNTPKIMPKRRVQDSAPDSDHGSPPRRRRVDSEEEDDDLSGSNTDAPQSATQSSLQTMISKLVRYALSAEYARIPIRRGDISTKVLGESGSRQFKQVFDGAQSELRSKFGMQMTELPGRDKDKMGMIQRRAATQASQKVQSNSTRSWVLISILPDAYKNSTRIVQPALAPSLHSEATYTALYTFLISLILLSHSDAIPEAKLERYLKKANADSWTPIGQTDKILQKMVKDGYLVKTRDTSSGEEVIEYSVGPRGKIEVGNQGVKGLVRRVYEGSDIGQEELDQKLDRSLGIEASTNGTEPTVLAVEEASQAGQQSQAPPPRRRGRPRRHGSDDDD